ncbi:response regulator [Sorangium sp. So ce281]|uniref:response regulator n=1 Tax=unclassified Sorangium TaxID=2621164 RepID=UPI003F6184B6
MAFKDLKDAWRKRRAPPKDEAPRPVVLVIDDDAATRESVHYILQDRYDVLLCGSATEGLAAVRDDVCAVILDVKMEPLDGFWACDELRRKQPDIPIIFYSAYQDIKDPSRVVREHRPFAYIVKDGDINRIVATVDTAVRVHTTMTENKRSIDLLQGTKRDG